MVEYTATATPVTDTHEVYQFGFEGSVDPNSYAGMLFLEKEAVIIATRIDVEQRSRAETFGERLAARCEENATVIDLEKFYASGEWQKIAEFLGMCDRSDTLQQVFAGLRHRSEVQGVNQVRTLYAMLVGDWTKADVFVTDVTNDQALDKSSQEIWVHIQEYVNMMKANQEKTAELYGTQRYFFSKW